MKRLKLTLINDFHNTEVTLLAKATPRDGIWELSPHQVRRAARALCCADCICGGFAGQRGMQSHHLEPRGDGGAWVWEHEDWD